METQKVPIWVQMLLELPVGIISVAVVTVSGITLSFILAAIVGGPVLGVILAYIFAGFPVFVPPGAVCGFRLADRRLDVNEKDRKLMVLAALICGYVGALIGWFVQSNYFPSLGWNTATKGEENGIYCSYLITFAMTYVGYRLAALKRSSYGQDTTC